MPTLIRLLVVLLVLAGLAYGGMFALVATVQPPDKEITIRIPARDLVPSPARDPLVQREIDTTRTAPPVVQPVPAAGASADAPSTEATDADPAVEEAPDAAPEDDSSVVTLAPGVE